MEKTPNQQQNRQVAFKVRIAELLEGRYVKEEGWQPNYIITPRGDKVSRANIIATIVGIEPGMPSPTIVVDDGSGTINLRTFDENKALLNLSIGMTINIIGKPREFGSEKYLVPEIVREIRDPRWINIRNAELGLRQESLIESMDRATQPKQTNDAISLNAKQGTAPAIATIQQNSQTPAMKDSSKIEIAPAETDDFEMVVDNRKNPSDIICDSIRSIDQGDGADIDEIIASVEKEGVKDAEKIIDKLLKEGEIFEIRKGKVKLLE